MIYLACVISNYQFNYFSTLYPLSLPFPLPQFELIIHFLKFQVYEILVQFTVPQCRVMVWVASFSALKNLQRAVSQSSEPCIHEQTILKKYFRNHPNVSYFCLCFCVNIGTKVTNVSLVLKLFRLWKIIIYLCYAFRDSFSSVMFENTSAY